MTKRFGLLVLMTGLASIAASEVSAQTPSEPPTRMFLNVNVGAQPSRRFIATTTTLNVYEETATVATNQRVGNGAVIDVSGGYRVWRNLAIGVGFASFSNTGTSEVVATVPDPLFFDRPAIVTTTASGLEHSESTVHLQAVWFVPVTDKMDVVLSAGPSFVRVKQQLVSSVSVTAGTQNVSPIVGDETGTANGFHVGFDGNYFFTARLGAGVFVRYTKAALDLPSTAGLTVAGLNAGVGVRVRF